MILGNFTHTRRKPLRRMIWETQPMDTRNMDATSAIFTPDSTALQMVRSTEGGVFLLDALICEGAGRSRLP